MNESVIFRCARDNETVVEVQSSVRLTFESTMDKEIAFCENKKENGFYFYQLKFPVEKKYAGRKLKIKSCGFETHIEPLELQAKVPVGLSVERNADYLYIIGRFNEALKEYEMLYSINPQDEYVKNRINQCNKKIDNDTNEDWKNAFESLKKEVDKLKGESGKIVSSQEQKPYQQNNHSNVSQNNNSSFNSRYTGQYKYQTTFDNPPFEIPLRESPNVNSREIFKCPPNAIVYVIDDSHEVFSKVYVNEYTGYLSKRALKMNDYTSHSSNNNSTSTYIYQTTFDNPSFEVPLREAPNVNSREIFKCPPNSTIYVIDNKGETYFKVKVNEYIGYVSKRMLKRQW